MAIDVTRWLYAVAQNTLDLACGSRIARDDTNRERVFTDAEHAIIQRWIEDAERIEDEAKAMLRDWTALPSEKS